MGRIFDAHLALGEMIIRNYPDVIALNMATTEPQYAYAELIAAIRKEMTATNLVSYCIGHAAKRKVQMNIVGKKGERKERNLKNPVAQVPNHFILVERPPEKMVSE